MVLGVCREILAERLQLSQVLLPAYRDLGYVTTLSDISKFIFPIVRHASKQQKSARTDSEPNVFSDINHEAGPVDDKFEKQIKEGYIINILL